MTQLTIKNTEAQFLALQQSSKELAERCAKLTITDDTTEKIAIQNYSMLKDIIGQIEDVRRREKAPYFEAGKQIDALAKKLSDPLSSTLEAGRQKVSVYNREKKAAEQKRVDKIKSLMVEYSISAITQFDKCETIEELTACRENWVKSMPGEEMWFEFMPDAEAMKVILNDYCKNKRIQLQSPDQADEVVEETIKEVITEQMVEVVNREVEQPKTTTKFKGLPRFRVLDEASIPREWLMLDEAKVKAYQKEFKETLSNGQVVNGIEFYIDESVVIK